MKVRNSLLLESKKVSNLNAEYIDLNKISKMINDLNRVIAPTINDDLGKIDIALSNKMNKLKEETSYVKQLNDDVISLKLKKDMIMKKIKIISLLSDLHATYKVDERIRKESVNIINDIDSYNGKRLDMQIQKLSNILQK